MSLSPLPPVRVLLTRPAEQSQAWALAIAAAGAVPVIFPTIEVGPPPSWQPLDDALSRLSSYDWVIFTSAAAVRFTIARVAPDLLAGRLVAAVGEETTRALASAGVAVKVLPMDQRGVGLAAALAHIAPGTRVLFPQALGGRPELRDALIRQGCLVDVVPASQTLPVHPLPELPPFDVATFASPSALQAFVAGLGMAPLQGRAVIALGPTTAAAVNQFGLRAFVASTPNAAAVVDAIAAALPGQPSMRR